MAPPLSLALLPDRLAVCRLGPDAPLPTWAGLDGEGAFASATRTPDELSVVCAWADVPDPRPEGVRVEGPMRALRVNGPLAFDVVGVAAALTAPLASAGVPVLLVATFDTDYVLVAERHARTAVRTLERAGHAVATETLAIRFDTAETPFGMLLAATTARGLAWAALGDDAGELAEELRRAFPGADVRAGELAPVLAALVRTLDGGTYDGPLDLSRGTPFQQRVWARLRAVGFGQTTTYAHLAADLGLPPAAARTIGQAVGANPLALAIPCHRVVRADGRATDFRWGAARKAALLAHEGGGQLALFPDA